MMSTSGRVAFVCLASLLLGDLVLPATSAEQVYGPSSPVGAAGLASAAEAPHEIPSGLAEAVALAVNSHPMISAGRAQERALLADVQGAKWLRYPSVTVEASAASRAKDGNAPNGVTPNLVAEVPLWTFDRIPETIARARALLNAGGGALAETRREIVLRTVQAWFEVQLAARREAIIRDSLGEHQRLLETIERRVEHEVSPLNERALVQSRIAQLDQDLAATRGSRANAMDTLSELVGQQVAVDMAASFKPRGPAAGADAAVGSALACDPTIRRLGFETSAAQSEREIARSGLFPEVLGQVSHNDITGTRAGLVVRVQTGSGLSKISAAENAAMRAEALTFEVKGAERRIREAVHATLVTLDTARDRAAAGISAAEAAATVTESYKRQFIAGRRSWLDVMNAVREGMGSRMSVADAEVSAMAASARLMVLTCEWKPGDTGNEMEGTAE